METEKRAAKRHRLSTRVWHWVNALCLLVLMMSGLNIFNAHPRLYWGEYGSWDDAAWLVLERFPHWMTIPGFYSLADARRWHFLFAWIFAIGLTLFIVRAIWNRHVQRDLHMRREEWRISNIWNDIKTIVTLSFPKGRDAKDYKVIQKLTYLLIIFILLPLMIWTGLAMSPAMDANWPWLSDAFGGRQSARSAHFIVAWTLAALTAVHIVMVLLSGPIHQIWGMIAGGESRDD